MTKKITLYLLLFLISLFLVMQLLFITTEQYTTAFVNHFQSPVLTSVCLAIPTILLINLIHSKRLTVIVIALCIFNILIAFIVHIKLDKTNRISYRKDLGIGAVYIYLDTSDNTYILERTSPMRTTVYIGKFKQDSLAIYFDKSFKHKGEQIHSLNLQQMNQLK